MKRERRDSDEGPTSSAEWPDEGRHQGPDPASSRDSPHSSFFILHSSSVPSTFRGTAARVIALEALVIAGLWLAGRVFGG
jgi:hypothetical protein